jgi:seryl-tRNA(Sec) selenium transferase
MCSGVLYSAWSMTKIYNGVSDAFTKLWEVTINFLVSVCMEELGSDWIDFHEIWYLMIFWKSVKKMHVSLKFDKNNGYFIQRPLYMIMSCWILLSVSDKSCIGSQNAHYVFSIFFSEYCAINEIVEKYGRARQGTDGSTWCTRDMIFMPHN